VRPSGRYVTTTVAGEAVSAFVPAPLPPEPAIQLAILWRKLDHANQALGRLDGLTRLLPDPRLFIYFYVRKEAVLSSQIEGTQSSLSDLLLWLNLRWLLGSVVQRPRARFSRHLARAPAPGSVASRDSSAGSASRRR
jgi:hypothetical protein